MKLIPKVALGLGIILTINLQTSFSERLQAQSSNPLFSLNPETRSQAIEAERVADLNRMMVCNLANTTNLFLYQTSSQYERTGSAVTMQRVPTDMSEFPFGKPYCAVASTSVNTSHSTSRADSTSYFAIFNQSGDRVGTFELYRQPGHGGRVSETYCSATSCESLFH